MAFIFGENAFAASSMPAPTPAPAESCGSTDSVSLESVDPNGEEWDMWETMKALRAQTRRRGQRAAKYRLAALRFKRSSVCALRDVEKYKGYYQNALERTEAITNSFATLLDELDDVKAELAARKSEPLPDLNEKTTCAICLCYPRRTVFVPCGHIVCCQQCADRIVSHAGASNIARCPICKKEIERVQVLYNA